MAMLMVILTLPGELYSQVPAIAIEPYKAKVDRVSGEVLSWGQKIILRDFDVELPDRIQQVPIFCIQYEGLHHAKAKGMGQVEARAKCIAERLAVAFDLLGYGGKLVVGPDDGTKWRLSGLTAPAYGPAGELYPAIYIEHSNLADNPLRIVTIFPEDVAGFPRMENEQKLATYIRALVYAHYELFFKRSSHIRDYEGLRIDQTREGKIFKEIFIRAQEAAELKNLNVIDDPVLKDALARIAMPQGQRLVNMAFKAPRDW